MSVFTPFHLEATQDRYIERLRNHIEDKLCAKPAMDAKEGFCVACWLLLPNVGNLAGYRIILAKSHLIRTKALLPRMFPTAASQVVMWTAYNAGMSCAAYLVCRDGGGPCGAVRIPMVVYVTSLCYSWAWPALFYDRLDLKLALLDITVLCGIVAMLMRMYRPVNSMAVKLTVPCLFWLINVAVFNFRVWRNSRVADGYCEYCVEGSLSEELNAINTL